MYEFTTPRPHTSHTVTRPCSIYCRAIFHFPHCQHQKFETLSCHEITCLSEVADSMHVNVVNVTLKPDFVYCQIKLQNVSSFYYCSTPNGIRRFSY